MLSVLGGRYSCAGRQWEPNQTAGEAGEVVCAGLRGKKVLAWRKGELLGRNRPNVGRGGFVGTCVRGLHVDRSRLSNLRKKECSAGCSWGVRWEELIALVVGL